MRRSVLLGLFVLLCISQSGAQSLSLPDLEVIYELKTYEEVNVHMRKLKWEGNTTTVRNGGWEVSWQYLNSEDIMVKQDSTGARFISYRLRKAADIQAYQAKAANFKRFEKLPSNNPNVQLFRHNNELQQLTTNHTKKTLTIRYEENPNVSFWTTLIDRNSKSDPYAVGSYLPSEGGVVIGLSPDGTQAYVVAMQDACEAHGSCWSAVSVLLDGVYTTNSWRQASVDFAGQQNSKVICNYLLRHQEVKQRAPQLAQAYRGANFTDWYLPSIGQLKQISESREDINEAILANGGTPISHTWYWSSTQYNKQMVWALNFNTLIIGQSAKMGQDLVRSVRSVKVVR